MSFILNAGEFDLGAGFIGRGTILAGEAYAVGTSTTGVQGLLNTSGLEGISYFATQTLTGGSATGYANAVEFRSSDDLLTGTFASGSTLAWIDRNAEPSGNYLQNSGRFALGMIVYSTSLTLRNRLSYLNSSSTSTKIIVSPALITGSEPTTIFNVSSNWRFLARDHATALTEYPDTDEEGSVFAASCINSATQWGLWIAGEVGDRSDYFNQTQGYFAIVLL